MANERKRRVQLGTPWTIVALLIGWIVVVVVGGGREPDADPLLGVENVGMVLVGGLLLLALAGLILLVYIKPQRNGEDIEPPAGRKAAKLFWAILFALLLIWRPDILWELLEEEDEDVTGTVPDVPSAVAPDEPAAESVAQATDVFLVLLVVGVLAALWFYARRRLAPLAPLESVEPQAGSALEADLLVAIDDAAIELNTTDDPRTGVMRAYAALEQVLASQKNKRIASETPTEHLRRALANLRIDPEPLIQLGSLYELARFSSQDISPDQQRQAGAALQRSRDELAALL